MKKAADAIGLLEAAVSPLGVLATVTGIPGFKVPKEVLKTVKESLKARAQAADKNLDGIRADIDANLRKAGRRIVIVIDDIDRLQPAEIR